jgi:opacity protein-like surface antigen
MIRSATLVALLLVLGAARDARADVTGFVGANTTPANRLTEGFAVGAGLLIVGFEFEYANTPDDPKAVAPALQTYMGNVLVQTPFPIMGFQPYLTTGGGIYNESLGTHSDTSFGTNLGGGVKLSLVGPVRLRIDYRVFNLGSGALNSPVQRVYAGVNLKF